DGRPRPRPRRQGGAPDGADRLPDMARRARRPARPHGRPHTEGAGSHQPGYGASEAAGAAGVAGAPRDLSGGDRVKALDLFVIVAYLVIVAAIGLKLSGRQKSATDYFVGERNLPWWAVSFSIIATETSTLTVISVPGVAFLTGLSYVELAIGYIIGRILVAAVLLPLYFKGKFRSAYEYLGERFGPNLHGLASLAFLITRLLAEGVRLFASAIPIKLLLGEIG